MFPCNLSPPLSFFFSRIGRGQFRNRDRSVPEECAHSESLVAVRKVRNYLISIIIQQTALHFSTFIHDNIIGGRHSLTATLLCSPHGDCVYEGWKSLSLCKSEWDVPCDIQFLCVFSFQWYSTYVHVLSLLQKSCVH